MGLLSFLANDSFTSVKLSRELYQSLTWLEIKLGVKTEIRMQLLIGKCMRRCDWVLFVIQHESATL